MGKYDIYELMNKYCDTEFAPEADEKADIKTVRKLVNEKIKLPYRHIKLKFLVVAAAVAAAACTGAIISASPDTEPTVMYVDMLTEKGVRLEFGYSEERGGNYFSEDHSEAEKVSPVELRGDRLWFVADGQEFDLTDMIDMETAYIYKTTNPQTKLADWLIIGGTPEYYMCYEYVKYGEGKGQWSEECNCNKEFCWHDAEYISGAVMPYLDTYEIDGVEIPAYKMTEEEIAEAKKKVEENTGEVIWRVRTAPWMPSVADEFNFSEPNEFNEDYIFMVRGDGAMGRV